MSAVWHRRLSPAVPKGSPAGCIPHRHRHPGRQRGRSAPPGPASRCHVPADWNHEPRLGSCVLDEGEVDDGSRFDSRVIGGAAGGPHAVDGRRQISSTTSTRRTRPGWSLCRSSVAHGTVAAVDVDAARAMPGVLAVYHAGGDDSGLRRFRGSRCSPETFNRPVFARDRVRFVGDIVAAVVAETGAQAVDAAEAVVVDIDPLPVVVSQADALGRRRPAAVPQTREQRVLRHRLRCRRGPARRGRGGGRGGDGQPAPRRSAHGDQWLPHRSRRAGRGNHLLDVAPGAPLGSSRRWRASSASSPSAVRVGLPVGGRRLRSKGGGVRRVPRGRGRGHANSAGR